MSSHLEATGARSPLGEIAAINSGARSALWAAHSLSVNHFNACLSNEILSPLISVSNVVNALCAL